MFVPRPSAAAVRRAEPPPTEVSLGSSARVMGIMTFVVQRLNRFMTLSNRLSTHMTKVIPENPNTMPENTFQQKTHYIYYVQFCTEYLFALF